MRGQRVEWRAPARLGSHIRAWVADRLAGTDPYRAVAVSWWLALVALWVVQQAHDGQHERHELPAVLHLLRDAALAVPLAALAVLGAGALLAPRLRRSSEGARDGLKDADRLLWVLTAALLFAVLSIPGHELHGALFGVEQSEVGWILHAGLDASIAAIGAVIALFPLAIVMGPPVRREPLLAPAHGAADTAELIPFPALIHKGSTR
jgi:hypothetical protein